MNRPVISKIIALCLTLCLLACGLGSALADSTPLLYKVTDENGNRIYLLGTIHVGRDDMFPIAGFDEVLGDCDAVALEIYTDEYFPLEGETAEFGWNDVKDLLSMFDLGGTKPSPELLEKLAALPGMEGCAFMLPFMSLSALTSLAMLSALETAGVDADKSVENYVVDCARAHGLELMGLETVEEQDTLINSQSDALLLAELEESVEGFDEGVEELNAMLTAWSEGDRANFLEEEELPEDDALAAEWSEFDKQLTDDRNIGFLEDAEGFLKEGRTVLIAIGADHVYGINGLVDLLAERGYTVEELRGR